MKLDKTSRVIIGVSLAVGLLSGIAIGVMLVSWVFFPGGIVQNTSALLNPIAMQPTSIPPTLTPTATPTRTGPPRISIAQGVTGTVRTAALAAARAINLVEIEPGEPSDVTVSLERGTNGQLLTEQVLAVVDWFPSQRTSISARALQDLWLGKPITGGITTLLASDDVAAALAEKWGPPADTVTQVPAADLVERLWADHKALAIMLFDALVPKVKALAVDGVNILDRETRLDSYPLVVRYFIGGDETYIAGLMPALQRQVPQTNRDPSRMTKLIMTGVTAISRTSALEIDQAKDPALPARKVAEVLAAADLTTVSNEVPFTSACKPVLGTLVLCSKPEYIATLELAGVDLVGLTGNHVLDYGPQAFLDTLDLFDSKGFRYYGGGRDAKNASEILYVEDHGNKLAFLGMNSFGPPSAWATASRPGAQQYNAEQLKLDLEAARKNADVVLLDMQADETYQYEPDANNKSMFRAAIQAGADVVTGVQAHQPQAVEFTPDGSKIILYGLGNLFFDQMQSPNVRQGLVVRHTIYSGHLLQTELLPTMLEDYVQPRWATPEEQAEIFKLVFGASGFK